ncbi:hypothetical protein H4R26_004023 [Coemansia thaxteri]|uniref:BD-FAE-like domain-containing protein n=1 Tax=Coemansia thaxteri TaxID=2663907 RepID=A0A9W8BBW3_9FUNG|nr:hypothetical protein H4R26_004023 [Coemansia thaxteri]
MPAYRDVVYIANGSPKHTLDMYLPDQSVGQVPLAIIIHGGAWRAGDKSECEGFGRGLVTTARGNLAVAAINYELSNSGPDCTIRHPRHLNDAMRAVQFLVSDTEDYPGKSLIDRSKVYLIGHSAGAHLAMLMVLSTNSELGCLSSIKGVLGAGGIYDIPGLLVAYPSYSEFVDMAFDPAQHQEASPQCAASIKQAGADHVKFLVVSSTGDTLIHSNHAASFASQLVRANYSDVALVVRDFDTHYLMVDNEALWKLAIDFVETSQR